MKDILREARFYDPKAPLWPCPSCEHGTLVSTPERFLTYKDAATNKDGGEDWFEFESFKFVFIASLECNTCGEAVVVTGTGGLREDERSSFDQPRKMREYFDPTFFQPALNIIDIPASSAFPLKLRALLEKSFTLFWCDYDACANRLRACLEILLDDLRVPRRKKEEAKKDLPLHERIKLLNTTNLPHKDVVEVMIMAVKWIGNTGSHEAEGISRIELIEGYEMLEHCLKCIYPVQDPNIEKLFSRAQEINIHKTPRTKKQEGWDFLDQ